MVYKQQTIILDALKHAEVLKSSTPRMEPSALNFVKINIAWKGVHMYENNTKLNLFLQSLK